MSAHRLILEEHLAGFAQSGLLSFSTRSKFSNNGVFIEVGTARKVDKTEFAASSTYYLAKLAEKFGKKFYSIDIEDRSVELHGLDNVICSTDLAAILKTIKSAIHVLYLDGHDVILNADHEKNLRGRVGDLYQRHGLELNNKASATSHLQQLLLCLEHCDKGSIICIDDTRFDYRLNRWWGKGALVAPYMLRQGVPIFAMGAGGLLFKLVRKTPESPAMDLSALIEDLSSQATFGNIPQN